MSGAAVKVAVWKVRGPWRRFATKPIASPHRRPHRPPRGKAMVREDSKPHILIVEDARDIREPLARYLREHGYRTTTAPDVLAARKALRSSGIDLAVLDIMMP